MGGGVSVEPISIAFLPQLIFFSHENYKDDQNGLIHPENIIGGVRAEISAVSQTF